MAVAVASPAGHPAAMIVTNYALLQHVVTRYLERGTRIFADTETTGLNPRSNKLVAIQIWQGQGVPVIVDMRQFDTAARTERVAEIFKPLTELVWVGHNFAGFDWAVLAANGILLKHVFDTQIAEQVLRSVNLNGDVSLADCVQRYCGVELDKSSRDWFYRPTPLDERIDEWRAPFPDEEVEYMARDVAYLPQVFRAQCERLLRQNLMPTMQLEMRALPAISQMRLTGIHIDVDAWREVIADKAEEAKQLEGEVLDSELGLAVLKARTAKFETEMVAYKAWEQARDTYLAQIKGVWEELNALPDHAEKEKWGNYKNRVMKAWREANPNPGKPKPDTKEVNLGSSQQLIAALHSLGIPVPTKKDKQSGEVRETVGAKELERMAAEYPVVKPLLAYRKAEKMVSSFGESLLERVEDDGRIHPQYNQIGAETGRMSCKEPNWQQIPSRGDGVRLRQCVTAPDGYLMLTADLPNIELRILADLSGDENMLAMFASGEDLHSYTARKMFNLPDSMTNDEVKAWKLKPGLKGREAAKQTNFGVAYGESEYGLANTLNISVEEARDIINMWNGLYARARQYLTEEGELAVSRLQSVTAAGRKRYYELPEKPRNRYSDEYKAWRSACGSVQRQGMNYPMQGLCADIVKQAVANFYGRVEHPLVRMVTCVHDEIVVQVPFLSAPPMRDLLAECMRDACVKWLRRVAIPEIDVVIADRWEKEKK